MEPTSPRIRSRRCGTRGRAQRSRSKCKFHAAFRVAAAPQAGQLCSSIMDTPNSVSKPAVAESEGMSLSAWWFISAPQRGHFIFPDRIVIRNNGIRIRSTSTTTRRFHGRSAEFATSRSALSGIYQPVEGMRNPTTLRLG